MKTYTVLGNPMECILAQCLNAREYMKEAREMERLINDKQLKSRIGKAIEAIMQVLDCAYALNAQEEE